MSKNTPPRKENEASSVKSFKLPALPLSLKMFFSGMVLGGIIMVGISDLFDSRVEKERMVSAVEMLQRSAEFEQNNIKSELGSAMVNVVLAQNLENAKDQERLLVNTMNTVCEAHVRETGRWEESKKLRKIPKFEVTAVRVLNQHPFVNEEGSERGIARMLIWISKNSPLGVFPEGGMTEVQWEERMRLYLIELEKGCGLAKATLSVRSEQEFKEQVIKLQGQLMRTYYQIEPLNWWNKALVEYQKLSVLKTIELRE